MANQFKEVRNALQVSQVAFGELIGMTRSQVQKQETLEATSPETMKVVVEKVMAGQFPEVVIATVRTMLGLDKVEEPKAEKVRKPKAEKAQKPYAALKAGDQVRERPASAQALVAIRISKNMNQKQFGEALGISASLIAQLETQGTEGRDEMITRAKALKALEGEQIRRQSVPIDPTAAKLLKTVRKNRGLSLAKMGEKIGYSGPMVFGFESQKRGIPEEIKTKILAMHHEDEKAAKGEI